MLGFVSERIDGSVPATKRQELIERFNDAKSSSRIMLISLRAGGVGLNLIGANHLFMLDHHWNPALEAQACDRVYRVWTMCIVIDWYLRYDGMKFITIVKIIKAMIASIIFLFDRSDGRNNKTFISNH